MRARVAPDEQPALLEHAALLGIEQPFSLPYLRQNWGRCVFYDAGCRLHRTFGPAAKPAVCRAFPTLRTGVDPACFHPGPAGPSQLQVDWDDLTPGRQARTWLDTLPLAAVLDGPTLGPMTADVLTHLVRADPAVVPAAHRSALTHRLEVLVHEQLLPQGDPLQAAHGGAQLLAGVGRIHGFPAWVRLLKLGLFGRHE